ncbi:hypothetical protein Ahy_B08g089144 isoform A [Arachis hypogaea]|uniref:Uncharacterized protein n=1 Tax=Arachis hypogaea TaxID=3818 RepID=A0A444XWU2_ARAHY|nr:hypothetical protein Ahy_B08g089144 isoform A [Arachis hypogaea]
MVGMSYDFDVALDDFESQVRSVYPRTGDGLLDFLVQQKIKDWDVSLCPRRSQAIGVQWIRNCKEFQRRDHLYRRNPQRGYRAPSRNQYAFYRGRARGYPRGRCRMRNFNQNKKLQIETGKEVVFESLEGLSTAVRPVSQEVISSGVRTDAQVSPGLANSPEVVVVTAAEASRKRKRPEDPSSETFEEEGLVPSVMDRRFDAPGFIDQHLMPGTEPFFYGCDVSFQAKSVYRALLRSAVVVRKAEPMMAQVGLLDKKLRHSQAEMVKLKEKLEAAEVAREKAVKSSEEAGAEILRLSEVETSLLSQLCEEQLKASNAGSQAAVLLGELEALKAEVAALKREKMELLADAKDAITATEETMKAQALVLAPGVDVSVMGAFKTVRDGQIADLE